MLKVRLKWLELFHPRFFIKRRGCLDYPLKALSIKGTAREPKKQCWVFGLPSVRPSR